jgi:hypothetical protein
MDVPVNKIIRMILVDQPAKAFKSPVTQIFCIVDKARRRMRHDDVNSLMPPDRRPQPADDGPHLGFGVLKTASVVPAGAFKTQKTKTLYFFEPAVQIKSALGQFAVVSNIMVAAHKVQRSIKGVEQQGKVFRRQITAGNDDIDVCKGLLARVPVQHRIDDIRY